MNDRLADIGASIDDWTEVTVHDNDGSVEFQSPPAKKTRTLWNKRLRRKKKKKAHGVLKENSDFPKEKSMKIPSAMMEDDSLGDIELGTRDSVEPTHMDVFFKEVEKIKIGIESVKEAVTFIHKINEEALKAINNEKETELSDRLKPVLNETNTTAKRTKQTLSLLKEETSKLNEKGHIKQTDLRIRQNLVNTLTRKFVDEIKLYQNAQQKYKMDVKSKASRQIRNIFPDAKEEEVDFVIRSEGGRDELYKETLLSGGLTDAVRNAYIKVSSRYQDVLTLEHSLDELHQMFVDVALLTEQQGELLDNIENHVKKASNAIDDGNEDLVKSIEYTKAIRKKQACIIMIALCVAVVVFVILFA